MNDWQLIKWLFQFIKPFKIKITLAICFGILSNISVVAIPLLATFTTIAMLNHIKVNLPLIFISLILLGFLRGICRYIEQYCNHDIAFHLLAHLRDQIFHKLRQIGPSYLSNSRSGDLITNISTDVEALEVFFAHTISPIFIALFTSLFYFVLFFKLSPILAIILLCSHCITGFIIPLISYRQNRHIGDAYKENFVDLSQELMEDFHSLTTIRQFNLTKERITRLNQTSSQLNQANYLKLQQNTTLQILSEIMLFGTAMLILVVGLLLQMNYSLIFFFCLLSLSTFGPILALNQLGNGLLVTLSSGRRLYQLMQTKATITYPEVATNYHNYQNLAFKNVSFTYPISDVATLNDINLTLQKNNFFSIKGASGEGKSTLLKLIRRYYNPSSGTITLNQNDIQQYSKTTLDTAFGVMNQNTFIFTDSIFNNITLNNPKFTEKQVIQACQEANLHNFITSLPKGYETKLSSQNTNLSAGQKQRIGLARLFLYNQEVFLLDEPTSHLDYLNELTIMQTIQQKKDSKTILLVSHRDTTLAFADTHYYLNQGTLIKST